jgi:hypothetical protein
MTHKHYRRQNTGILGLVEVFMNRTTQKQAESLHLATSIPIEQTNELRPRELEELAADVFLRLGYKNVEHTGGHASIDGGVDVWMLNNEGNVEIVQCKQIRNRVDKSELVYFVKIMRQQHATRGRYWAPSGFTQPALDYAALNNVVIYEEPHIRRIVEKVYKSDLEQRKLRAAQIPSQPIVPTKPKANRYFGMTGNQFAIILIITLCIILSLLFSGLFILFGHPN